MNEIGGITFLFLAFFQVYLSNLRLNQPLRDQYIEKNGDFEFSIPHDTFVNDDDSTIFISVSSNDWISKSYENPVLEKEYFFVNPKDVVYSDGFCYLADNTIFGLVIANCTDRTTFSVISKLVLGGSSVYPSSRLIVDGKYAYVSVYSSGLYIVDIQDKYNPLLVSILPTFNPMGLCMRDDIIFLADNLHLKIINVTDRSSPSIISNVDISLAYDVVVDGSYAFIADWSQGVRSVNITDLKNPEVLFTQTGASVYSIQKSGNYLYVTEYSNGLKVYELVSDYTMTPVSTLTYSELSCSAMMGITVEGIYAYITCENGLSIVDISDPLSPSVEGKFSTTDGLHSLEVWVDDSEDTAFLASGQSGMRILDISVKSNPTILTQEYEHAFASDVKQVFVDDKNFVYYVDDTIKILDSYSFELVGTVNVPQTLQIEVRDQYLYVSSGLNRRFMIFENLNFFDVDISKTPEYIELVSYSFGGPRAPDPFRIDSKSEYAYIGRGSVIYLMDISNKTEIVYVKHYVAACLGIGIDDEDSILFLSGTGSVQLLNISAPDQPGNFPVISELLDDGFSYPENLVFDRDHLYLTDGSDGLKIISVENISQPITIASFDSKNARGLALRDGMAFLSDDTKGVIVIDVSQPSDPFAILTIPPHDFVEYVYVKGNNMLYIDDGSYGITTVRLDMILQGATSETFPYFCGETTVTVTATDQSGVVVQDSMKITREDYCNQHGTCRKFYLCDCVDGYLGDHCENWACGGFDSRDQETCSSHGNCISPDTCKCRGGYGNEFCKTNLALSYTIPPIITLVGVVCVCCCLFFILSLIIFCCFGFLALILSLCGSMGLVLGQTKKIKKFGKLENFDLLLIEQELDKDTSTAKLRIKKSLFEIDMEDITCLNILGEGGSDSIVFKCMWSGQIAAFKCFKTRYLMNSQDKFTEFEKEVELLSSLSHPNIIRFFGASLNPPRVGIVMELCPNGEILDFVKDFRKKYQTEYPIPQKIRLVKEISSSLEYLHSKNIIHRDLKCENVLISKDKTAKLMDFGLSRLVENMASANKTTRVGTSFYMAPEIVFSGRYDEKCDVFSFAMLVYIVFTEIVNPYEGIAEIYNIEMQVASNADLRPDLTRLVLPKEWDGQGEWLVNLIRKNWSNDPGERNSFKEIRKILEENGSIENYNKHSSQAYPDTKSINRGYQEEEEEKKEEKMDDFSNSRELERLREKLLSSEQEKDVLRNTVLELRNEIDVLKNKE